MGGLRLPAVLLICGAACALVETSTCLTSPIADMACYADVAEGLELHWRSTDETLTFALRTTTTGWVGIAFTNPEHAGSMGPADGVIAVHSNASVLPYFIQGESIIRLNLQQEITDVSYVVEAGWATMRFTRKRIGAGGTVDLSRVLYVNYARRAFDGRLDYHGHSEILRGSFQIDTATGAAEYVVNRKQSHVTHGILMIVAWIYCAPLAIILMRYLPRDGIVAPMWIHAGLQVATVGLTLGGAILALVDFSPIDAEHRHGQLGIAVLALVCAQAIGALFRCPEDADFRWVFNAIHWSVGRATYVIAVVNVFLGIEAYHNVDHEDSLKFHIASWVGLGVTVLSTTILEFFAAYRRRRRKRRKEALKKLREIKTGERGIGGSSMSLDSEELSSTTT